MQRSLMGLFLLALTLGLLALAAGSVRTTLEERWARESVSRPARERVFSVNVVQVTRTDVSPVITTYGEIRSRRTLDLRASLGTDLLIRRHRTISALRSARRFALRSARR